MQQIRREEASADLDQAGSDGDGRVIRFRFCVKKGCRLWLWVRWEIRDTDPVLWGLSNECVMDLLRQRTLREEQIGGNIQSSGFLNITFEMPTE